MVDAMPYKNKADKKAHNKKYHAESRTAESKARHAETDKARHKRNKKVPIIAVIDCETDPFEKGVIVKPFAWGFYDGKREVHFWGDDSTRHLVEFLMDLDEPHILYAHNGGKFDFHFMLQWLINAEMMIVNSRIIKWKLGEHELRDSFAILPIPLAVYKKDEFDYNLMKSHRREKHKDVIVRYMLNDCIYLYELVTAFIAEFGTKLTIGSASMDQFCNFHDVERLPEFLDAEYRPWYYGGRCQAFEKGVVRGRFKVYDVNSMYPYVMKTFKHPITAEAKEVKKPRKDRFSLIEFEGTNDGALPCIDDKTGSLTFAKDQGVFKVCSHEFFAAQELGLITVSRFIRVLEFKSSNFSVFVDTFFAKRLKAKEALDKAHDIFYKLILNSSYGKQGMNPREFKTYCITPQGEYPADYDEMFYSNTPWTEEFGNDILRVWKRPAPREYGFYHVAVAASITSAARAVLLRGIAASKRPVYCDTDSIICESLDAELSDKKLGAWKLEGEGTRMSIGGKKLYALFNDEGECVKQANKGVKISADEITEIAEGGTVEWESMVPTFSLRREPMFVKRRVRMT